MKNIFDTLEWLTRYGFIDILFGLGIGGFIVSALRNRTVKEIEGVQIVVDPILSTDQNLQHKTKLYFRIKNLSGKPLYLYKVSFRPYSRSFLWWTSTTFVPRKPIKMSSKSRITTTRWHLPFLDSSPNGQNDMPVFLNYGEQCSLFFSLSDEYSLNPERKKEIEDPDFKYNFGTLLVNCIQGTSQITLKANI